MRSNRNQQTTAARFLAWLLWGALVVLGSGCAAITNPTANGIPVNRVPQQLLQGPQRDAMSTIPLHLLTQRPPREHRLASKDVLGIFINGVLPAAHPDQPPQDPPVYFPSQIDPLGAGLQPALGFPIPIREDGTISLPLVDPIQVSGMTVTEATEKIRNIYIEKKLVQAGRERIIVTLLQPRQTRVMVVREENGGFATGGRREIISNFGKRGTGHLLDLRAYENDVLHALNATGGLPGLDAYAEIIVFKGALTSDEIQHMRPGPCGHLPPALGHHQRIVRIPTRVHPHQPLPFHPRDVLLDDGDVVLLEPRPTEVFYTGGVLPRTIQTLPRDRDLDVLQAVALVEGPLVNGAIGGNNLSGNLISPGLGGPSPKLLTVVRRTPDGGQIPIKVDLDRALRDPRERIPVLPNDILVLQESPSQAMGRYISQRFDITSKIQLLSRGSAMSTFNSVVPDGIR